MFLSASLFSSLLFSVLSFGLVLAAFQVEQNRHVEEEEERGAYGTFTPDMLRAPPV